MVGGDEVEEFKSDVISNKVQAPAGNDCPRGISYV